METRNDNRDGRAVFRSMIRRAAAAPDNAESILADRQHVCRYPEIVEYLAGIQAFLTENGVTPEAPLTVELNNTVRAALLVLALLDDGYSFMAIPVSGQGARAGGGQQTNVEYARFARWTVSVKADRPQGPLEECAPESFLAVTPNPRFEPSLVGPMDGDPRLYFRTSGSLSTPKLVVHRYGRFHGNALNALQARAFNPSHRVALPTPIFHVYGLGAAFLAGLGGGASIDFQERSNILVFLEREADFAPNVAYVTPSFCETLIRARRSRHSYEYIVTSGDRISESAFRRSEELHGTMISQYGTTEMGIVSACSVDMPFDIRARTVGRTVGGVEVRIARLSEEDSERGELRIRNAYGFEGYVDLDGKPVVPETAFDGEWYRTGDLASLEPSNLLRVLGRCDLSVNRGGVLLPLADVESRLRDLADIEEVGVALGGETIRGRALVAFCVCRKDAVVTEKQLLARYAEEAPPYAVPDKLLIVDALPKLPSGKIDRRALAAQAAGAN